MDAYKVSLATLVSGVALTCMLDPPAFADPIQLQVYAAFAPNAYGSPSYDAWAQNAITAVENDQTSAGTPGTPAYFQEVTVGDDSDNIVTSFPSWNGVANPPAPYSNEYGNRLTFIVVATAPTGSNSINLSQLTGTMSSSDPGNVFGFSYNWGTGALTYSGGTINFSTSYSANQIGILAGGGLVDSGPNTQDVNELIAVGLGNALANTSTPGCSALGATQAAINCVEAQYDSLIPFQITTTFNIGGSSASETVDFVPEPGSLALFGSALLGLGLTRRRKKS